MSFAERIKTLAGRLPTLLDHLETEEATKNALVMPFIGALGYDVFNPLEVVPEYTADVGTKRGEKVDYAIKRGDTVAILIEAKKFGSPLKVEHSSQLYRYFSVANARIAILTDGVIYRFYSDLDAPNKMDSAPFLEIDLRDLRDNLLVQLRRVTKDGFDLDNMLAAATDLKHTAQVRQALEAQLQEPDEEFVRMFFNRAVPGGRFVQSAREQFTPIVSQAFNQMISDRVAARLRSALQTEDAASGRAMDEEAIEEAEELAEAEASGIETTEEELEGYRIIQAIVCGVVDLDRVAYRDTKSYFGVLLDDNNRKPIARLHFNRTQKYLGLFDADKNESKHAIESLRDLYKFADDLRAGTQRWL